MSPRNRSQHPILQYAIDALLENASLTDALEDDAANVLIRWGIANVRKIYQDVVPTQPEDLEEAMAPRLKANRRLMRAVSTWGASRLEKSNTENKEAFEEVLTLAHEVYADENKGPGMMEKALFIQFNLRTAEPEFVSRLRGLFGEEQENDEEENES